MELIIGKLLFLPFSMSSATTAGARSYVSLPEESVMRTQSIAYVLNWSLAYPAVEMSPWIFPA